MKDAAQQRNGLWMRGTIMALVGSLGLASAVFAAESTDPTPFGRTGNKGEAATSEEQATERLDRSIAPPPGHQPPSNTRQDAQITLGGSRPNVEGEVLKIFGEDYLIRDQTGSEVRLRVTKDTNLICGAGAGGGGQMMTGRQNPREHHEIPPTAAMQEAQGQQGHQQGQQQARQGGSEPEKGQRIVQEQTQRSQGQQQQQMAQSQQGQQRGQGQQEGFSARQERHADQSGTQSQTTLGPHSGGDVAVGSGFQIGEQSGCDFKVGDRVKAEVSDLGTALLLRKLSERERRGTSGSRMPGPDVVPAQ